MVILGRTSKTAATLGSANLCCVLYSKLKSGPSYRHDRRVFFKPFSGLIRGCPTGPDVLIYMGENRRIFIVIMQIYWHGYSAVRIEAKSGDKEATILTDPFQNEASLRMPRTVEADILLLSHQDRKNFSLENVQGKPFIISDPGEYEIKDAFVQGIQDRALDSGEKARPLVYRIAAEGLNVAFLGQLKRKLTDYEIEELGDVDILLLPVGGGEVMDSKLASETISTIEPRMVVPLHYDLPGIKTKLANVDAFCKALGVCKRQDANRLKISKKELPAEDMIVTVLERA